MAGFVRRPQQLRPLAVADAQRSSVAPRRPIAVLAGLLPAIPGRLRSNRPYAAGLNRRLRGRRCIVKRRGGGTAWMTGTSPVMPKEGGKPIVSVTMKCETCGGPRGAGELRAYTSRPAVTAGLDPAISRRLCNDRQQAVGSNRGCRAGVVPSGARRRNRLEDRGKPGHDERERQAKCPGYSAGVLIWLFSSQGSAREGSRRHAGAATGSRAGSSPHRSATAA
jgi:hypothetical protein